MSEQKNLEVGERQPKRSKTEMEFVYRLALAKCGVGVTFIIIGYLQMVYYDMYLLARIGSAMWFGVYFISVGIVTLVGVKLRCAHFVKCVRKWDWKLQFVVTCLPAMSLLVYNYMEVIFGIQHTLVFQLSNDRGIFNFTVQSRIDAPWVGYVVINNILTILVAFPLLLQYYLLHFFLSGKDITAYVYVSRYESSIIRMRKRRAWMILLVQVVIGVLYLVSAVVLMYTYPELHRTKTSYGLWIGVWTILLAGCIFCECQYGRSFSTDIFQTLSIFITVESLCWYFVCIINCATGHCKETSLSAFYILNILQFVLTSIPFCLMTPNTSVRTVTSAAPLQ